MKRLAALLAAFSLAGCTTAPKETAAPPLPDLATSRVLPEGPVVGFVDAATGAHAWRAIPFAKPPVGELRWRAPRPADPWTVERVSTGTAPWCPQILSPLDGVDKSRYGEIVGQEDCLYLNVYAPPMSAAQAATAKLPVMMWIHGGSNTWGRAEQYDGSALAARFKVVVVVVQYRIGALGWLAHPALREGGSLADDASANFGTLDQIRALEWIRDDITAFGGDTSRVTIFGESAGGHNVATLLTSPRAKGLFHRAIVQSGSFQSTPLEKAEAGDEPQAGMKAAERMLGAATPVTGAALRAVPVKDVFGAFKLKSGDIDPYRIIADGVAVPAAGLDSGLDQPGAYNAVPVITGTNRDEMKLFNALNPKLIRYVLGRLPVARDPALYEAASAYPSRMWRAKSVDVPAARMVDAGHAPVWTYRFDWDEEGKLAVTDLGKLLGAGHSLEIPFVFGHFQLLGAFDQYAFTKANAPTRIALSDSMMSYWVQFATTGDPGRGVDGKQPLWSPWSSAPDAPRMILFDTPAGGGVRMNSDLESGERIIKDLLADTSIKSEADRCQIVTRLLKDNPELKPVAAGRCT